jgi:mono/diheme cytochrome c family protein
MRATNIVALGLTLCAVGGALAAWSDSTTTAATDTTARASAAGDTAASSGPRDTTKTPVAPKPATRGDAAAGKKTFREKCVACHKADGSGGIKLTGNPTPDWRDARRMSDPKYDDAYLRDCITNGKPKSGMVAWSKQGVKPATIENLIAYIRTFARKK